MPTYRIPASLYIEAEDIHAAVQAATLYLDEASFLLPNWGSITAVDVEVQQAEPCPPFPVEEDVPATPVLDNRGEIEAGAIRPYLTP